MDNAKVIPAKHAALLDAVTKGLEVGDARKIDNTGGLYMALHVDRLSEKTYSLAHYFQSNGDSVCDPDGVFVHTADGWRPVRLQLATGHHTEALVLDDNDMIVGWRKRQYAELLGFCALWLGNVAAQQGGLGKIRAGI